MKKLILIIITLITIIGIGVVKLNAISLPLTWTLNNPAGTTWYAAGRMQVLEGSTTMDITLPDADDFHILENVGGFHSKFVFFKADGTTQWAVYDWEELSEAYFTGIIKINLLDLGFTHGVGDPYEIGVNIAFLEVQIAQTLTGFPNAEYDTAGDYETYLDANSEVAIDELINFVKFYSNMSIYSSGRFVSIPTEPVDPVGAVGYTFDGWYTADGEKYEFTAVTPEMFVAGAFGNYFYLYAHYRATGSQVVDTTDPATNLPAGFIDILDIIGFNNLSGFIFIFVAMSLIVIIGLVLLKVPVLAIAIVEVGLTGLFIYFGMLPLWIIIVIIVAMVMIFMWDLKVKDPERI